MAKNRLSTVVKASQPEFLSLVAIGCLMVASAILPLSVEGGYRFERDPATLAKTDTLNEDIRVSTKTSFLFDPLLLLNSNPELTFDTTLQSVDAACMAVPWLICIVSEYIYL